MFLVVAKEYRPELYEAYLCENGDVQPMIDWLYDIFPEPRRFTSRECLILHVSLIVGKYSHNETIANRYLEDCCKRIRDDSTTASHNQYYTKVVDASRDRIQSVRLGIDLVQLVARIEMLDRYQLGVQD